MWMKFFADLEGGGQEVEYVFYLDAEDYTGYDLDVWCAYREDLRNAQALQIAVADIPEDERRYLMTGVEGAFDYYNAMFKSLMSAVSVEDAHDGTKPVD